MCKNNKQFTVPPQLIELSTVLADNRDVGKNNLEYKTISSKAFKKLCDYAEGKSITIDQAIAKAVTILQIYPLQKECDEFTEEQDRQASGVAEIICGNEKTKIKITSIEKLLLKHRFKFFEKIFSTPMKESQSNSFPISEIDPEVFRFILKNIRKSAYNLHDNLDITHENVFSLLKAYDFLGSKDLVQRCDAFLAKHYLETQLIEFEQDRLLSTEQRQVEEQQWQYFIEIYQTYFHSYLDDGLQETCIKTFEKWILKSTPENAIRRLKFLQENNIHLQNLTFSFPFSQEIHHVAKQTQPFAKVKFSNLSEEWKSEEEGLEDLIRERNQLQHISLK